jgi:hypothetical protein
MPILLPQKIRKGGVGAGPQRRDDGPAFSARVFPWRKIPRGVKGGAPGVTPHMFRHVPPLAVLRVRRPLNRDRPWPGRPFPPPFFVGRLVGGLFGRGITQICQ